VIEHRVKGVAVELFPLATCSSGNCPTIYATSSGHVVVQGEPVPATDVQVNVPTHERLVRIPQSVLLDAAARLASAT
jgi:hypothetical protein